MAFATPIHTNEQSVDRVLAAGLPALLVFWRKGCAPCQQLDPALERIAAAPKLSRDTFEQVSKSLG